MTPSVICTGNQDNGKGALALAFPVGMLFPRSDALMPSILLIFVTHFYKCFLCRKKKSVLLLNKLRKREKNTGSNALFIFFQYTFTY